MIISLGTGLVDRYNSLLSTLMLTDNPKETHKKILHECIGLGVFFDNTTKKSVDVDGYGTFDLRYSESDNTIKLKDSFTIKDSIWYNSMVYLLVLLGIIVFSLFMPISAKWLLLFLPVSAVVVLVVYLVARFILKMKFNRIARKIIVYHERLCLVYDGMESASYKRNGVYYIPDRRTIIDMLKPLGINIRNSTNY